MTDGLLRELDVLHQRARRDAAVSWLPVMLFGALGLSLLPLYASIPPPVSAEPGFRSGQFLHLDVIGGLGTGRPTAIAVAWLVGVPLVCLLVGLYHRSRARRVGVAQRMWPFAAVAVALDVLLLVTALLGSPAWHGFFMASAGLVPYVVVAAGLAVLAWYERDRRLSSLAAAVGALAVILSLLPTSVLASTGINYLYWPVFLAAPPALLLFVAGLAAWTRQRRR